jgi:hypothetical protein
LEERENKVPQIDWNLRDYSVNGLYKWTVDPTCPADALFRHMLDSRWLIWQSPRYSLQGP